MLSTTLFNFSPNADISDWRIVDDVVMGGRSSGQFELNADGHGVFYGEVSLENNGGFSSLRYGFPPITVQADQDIVLRVKGDGKAYQLRVKRSARQDFQYRSAFETNGEWETIRVPLSEMRPVFRGRDLEQPNFQYSQIEELQILIGNGRAESFQLILDKIEIE